MSLATDAPDPATVELVKVGSAVSAPLVYSAAVRAGLTCMHNSPTKHQATAGKWSLRGPLP